MKCECDSKDVAWIWIDVKSKASIREKEKIESSTKYILKLLSLESVAVTGFCRICRSKDLEGIHLCQTH